MRSALLVCALGVVSACASEDLPSGRDLATDDTVDPEAKADAARPLGIYTLIDPYSFDTGAPRMEHLDLRRDDTFYIYEIGPVDNNGNLDEGYNSYFGTFTYNRDGYGNTYIRVKHETYGTWRYKYKLENDELQFMYTSGEVGWRMKHLDDPTAAHVARIQEVFEAGTNRRKATDRASVQPDAVWSRYYNVRDTGNYGVYTLNVDGEVHYMLLGDEIVEIYAANNQLLAEATRSETGWEWNEKLF